MSDIAYLRDEAQRCRDLAVSALDSELAKRWHQLADRYAVLAEQRAASETGLPSTGRERDILGSTAAPLLGDDIALPYGVGMQPTIGCDAPAREISVKLLARDLGSY